MNPTTGNGSTLSTFHKYVITELTIEDGILRYCLLLDDGRRLMVPPHTFTGVNGKLVLR